jgi:site-specific DNA-methyltransferase (cytosine-N4-specific)
VLGLKCPSSIHDLVLSLDEIKQKNYLTHGIHPYPAKFIPQIPACILERYSTTGQVILDPFCGSGTSLLEAMIRNRRAFGIDLNPIATMVSRAKTCILSSLERNEIAKLLDFLDFVLKERMDNVSFFETEVDRDEIPAFLNRDHWFQEHVQLELAWIKRLIKKHSVSSALEDLLNVCFSAIIVKVSNQESDTRWKAIKKRIGNGDVIIAFRKAMINNSRNLESLREIIQSCYQKPSVFTGPVLEVLSLIPPESIDLVVSSPPYLNSYDYYLYHKLRMFWLGYDHKFVQKMEIGSRNKHCDNNEDITSFTTAMTEVLQGLASRLKKNGLLALVVGDSIFRGNLYDMGRIYKQIASRTGYKLMEEASYSQRKYSKAFTPNMKSGNKETHILIFSKE